MTAPITRTLAAFDVLSRHPQGLTVQAVAAALGIAPSAAHRLLNDLVAVDYVRQHGTGHYALTVRLAALGLSWLGRSGITDPAQPVLDDLAVLSAELVRLSIADGDRLIWVAFAQGATSGLRYDPAREQGAEASLVYSASGRAWAASQPPARADVLIAAQGLTPPEGAADGHALTYAQAHMLIAETRSAGYAVAEDCFLAGMAAIAVAIPDVGCLSIAGPVSRLTPTRRAAVLPALQAAARQLGDMIPASALLRGKV
jgi:IclR family transcriptional regulator, acetate operon repressor